MPVEGKKGESAAFYVAAGNAVHVSSRNRKVLPSLFRAGHVTITLSNGIKEGKPDQRPPRLRAVGHIHFPISNSFAFFRHRASSSVEVTTSRALEHSDSSSAGSTTWYFLCKSDSDSPILVANCV